MKVTLEFDFTKEEYKNIKIAADESGEENVKDFLASLLHDSLGDLLYTEDREDDAEIDDGVYADEDDE